MTALTLETLRAAFADNGVVRAYAKFLAPNDNSKNQVYLGGDFGVLNILPSAAPVAARSDGTKREPIFKASVDLWWMAEDGSLKPAPNAQLILYPQYPEVRLSGYLSGVDRSHRPSAILGTTRAPGRVLILGVRNDGSIVGYAAGADTPIERALRAERNPEQTGVFVKVPTEGTVSVDSRRRLLLELCRVSRLGWIASKKLERDGRVRPYQAPNGGGYTLEAELGVRPNGYADPDFLGWEVKQYAVPDLASSSSGRITLMTPEPNDGVYKSAGVIGFLQRYGYRDLRGRANRLNFGGTFRAGEREARTGLTMTLLGFDGRAGKITDSSGGIALVDDDGNEAAVWRYAQLISHWNRKHASAVYVPSCARSHTAGRQYKYGSDVSLGIGTSFLLLLQTIDAGAVFYDPGIKVEGYPHEPKTKRRSQFRTLVRHLPALYSDFEKVNACARG